MAIVDLTDMKAHLGILSDDDDLLITGKLESAQAVIEQMLGFEFATRYPDTADNDYPDTVPADFKEAVRQLAGHYYENREASIVGVSFGLLPLGVKDIVRNRRDRMVASVEV